MIGPIEIIKVVTNVTDQNPPAVKDLAAMALILENPPGDDEAKAINRHLEVIGMDYEEWSDRVRLARKMAEAWSHSGGGGGGGSGSSVRTRGRGRK